MAGGKISELFVDATNLEINTILADGISGRKMPSIVVAFLEVIGAWANQLITLRSRLKLDRISLPGDLDIVKAVDRWNAEKETLYQKYASEEKAWIDPEDQSTKVVMDMLNVDHMMRFRRCVESKLVGKANADEHIMELTRLLKIQTRLSCLQHRFQAHFQKGGGHAPDLSIRDRQEIRKLWELKDGYIFAQDVVQLDGDIISRINRRLHRDRFVGEKAMRLLEYHRTNVDVAIKHWHFIIETIGKIAKAIGEKVVNPF